MVPIVLDIISPLNYSRDRVLILRAKYPVDPCKHYFLIQLQLVLFGFAVVNVIAGGDPMCMALVYHFIGLTSVIKLVT